jgi:hypothetical protein
MRGQDVPFSAIHGYVFGEVIRLSAARADHYVSIQKALP